MWKKRILCLVLVLCALVLCSCQQKKEVFSTVPQTGANTAAAQTAEPDAGSQNLFGDAETVTTDYDNGSYDPTSEEGGEWESVDEPENGYFASQETAAPTIQSDYAGATPVVIDPVDKPTATPLPSLSFSYTTYEAPALHMTFEGPSGWTVDESEADTFRLINPDTSMDYAASLTVRSIPVNKQYGKSELTKEIKGMLETLKSSGEYKSFSASNTAERSFLGSTGVYANYKATLQDGTLIAGRMIVNCIDKTLYTLHVSYPRGYTDFYVENVYDKFRHSVKMN